MGSVSTDREVVGAKWIKIILILVPYNVRIIHKLIARHKILCRAIK